MKVLLAFSLIIVAVFKVTEVSSCYYLASQLKDAQTKGVVAKLQEALSGCYCFTSIAVMVQDGSIHIEKGCAPVADCEDGKHTHSPKDGEPYWEELHCCLDPPVETEANPPDECNDEDFTTYAISSALGPTCFECESDDEACVNGGDEASGVYKQGALCPVGAGQQCYVEKKSDGTVKRGCSAAKCADVNKPGDETFTKCCRDANNCNKDAGAQTVFVSYVLLIACFLITYLK